MKEIEGAGVALVTPFKEDLSVDFDGLAKLIDYQIKEGVDYLVSLGTTGESATLSAQEKSDVWHFTAECVNKRVPLVAGIGGNHTMEVAKAIESFEIDGYSAILSVSPYYNKPTQQGIYAHYRELSRVSPLPLILYNVPGRTGSNITAATTVQLATDFSNIVAIKEASGNLHQISEILRDAPEGFKVISGDDPMTLPMMSLGAVGLISVIGNAYPKEVSKLVQSSLKGDYNDARNIQLDLLSLIDLCFVESNPCGVKYMLEEKGVCGSGVRLPLTKVSEGTQSLIKTAMQRIK